MPIKLSDYVAQFLAEAEGVGKHIFLVTGGGAMHLNDSIGRHAGLRYSAHHHEQACAIAAEGFARLSGQVGVCQVTTGPGGTNAMTGVLGAWLDSIPMVVISGQVKLATTTRAQSQLGLRQLGDQELDIASLVRPITKSAVMLETPAEIRYQLEKAVYLARSGRPGPTWLDIPLCVQSAMVEPDELQGYTPESPQLERPAVDELMALLRSAQRPVIVAGNGIALAGAQGEFRALVERLQIPVISTFARYDILRTDHPLSFGRTGTIGQRASNFIIQNADLVVGIGARFNIRAISYNWENFARAAKLVLVDIDPAELHKYTLKPALRIHADAGQLIAALSEALEAEQPRDYGPWIARCRQYRQEFPPTTDAHRSPSSPVNSYHFFAELAQVAPDDAVFVLANGTACVSAYQTLLLRAQQRVIVNSGCASMGYALPAAIGASFVDGHGPIICVTGEGSLQMNLQELQTVMHHGLPLKLFVLNNGGYASIRNTQRAYFSGFGVGAEPESGISFPNTLKLAEAYGLKACRIDHQTQLGQQLSEVLAQPGACVCEIMLSREEVVAPKLSSRVREDGSLVSSPLEDLAPFLPREQFLANMLIPPLED